MSDGTSSVSSQTGSSGITYPSTTTASSNDTTKNSLGKDDFLKLLVTQMQYQDPLQPMDNTQFVAQLAQFSSLEQMTNVANSQTSSLQALQGLGQSTQMGLGFNLLGNTVQVQTADQAYNGVVSMVKNDPTNGMTLVIGSDDIPLSSIVSIEKG